ncbi:MAG: family 1 glycosylhydrolase [Candidatus Eremiobacteraeota bacterium]|nr:family 1 glycosylhydrolase [Candidatus Eremiobacteraeota bacterium]MBV9057373.1 family 1 glycosylhydrolase [Candidatus Eremiobacteraeota bacterium]
MTQPLRFGVATADHQCEAYAGNDDIRDVWERVRGLVPRGMATDFWNRYREDIELARGLGCTVFRLSLSWARLEPQPDVWSDEAFAHYRDVLQAIRDAGMSALVTLVHNTWPLHVQAAGAGAGPLDPGFPDRVARFAAEVTKRLGDLIGDYVTLNEPNQLVYGWIKGFWMRAYAMPPGQPPYESGDAQMDDVLTLIPNLFRAHAKSREAIQKIHPTARAGTNPLVLGLPQWLQRWVDRNATHLQSPEAAKRQASRIAQSAFLEGGRVDCSIAQITITDDRLQHAFFSEPYYCAHVALLHAHSLALPPDLQTWRGRVAVVADTLPARIVGGWLPAATLVYAQTPGEALEAVRRGDADAAFDDDVTLQPYATDRLALTLLPRSEQYFAVALALGSRTLLNIVDRAIRDLRAEHPEIPNAYNRKTIADIGREDAAQADGKRDVPQMDRSIERIRKRGKLRVGVHPGVSGLCARDDERYEGLEPEIARRIAQLIFGDEGRVEFVEVQGARRLTATRSWLHAFFSLRKSIGIFGTLLGTNWWNLGMAGKLPDFLCPRECVGTLDFVGLDYYWGVPSFWPGELHRLSAAADFQYAHAPVWPGALSTILNEAAREFPGKPIIVIENGCVGNASGVDRADYLKAHIKEVRKAVERGAPVEAYLCWSITSNREWGLRFDQGSDFGLFHIDLDTDPQLKRQPTDASRVYASLIAESNSG